MSEPRPLTAAEQQLINRIRRIAYVLYEGRQTPHRSCGIAIAETLGCATPAYQSLRKGGITGEGECGAIKAGELVIGEYLGDPDPTGKITDELRSAAALYRKLWLERFDLGEGGRKQDGSITIICNDLIRPLGDFHGAVRHGYCTNMAAEVSALVCEVLLRHGATVQIPAHLQDFA